MYCVYCFISIIGTTQKSSRKTGTADTLPSRCHEVPGSLWRSSRPDGGFPVILPRPLFSARLFPGRPGHPGESLSETAEQQT